MRTLIISDLHLGSLSGADLLRRAGAARAAARGARGRRPAGAARRRARAASRARSARRSRPRSRSSRSSARALAGRELVLVAGNHDHALDRAVAGAPRRGRRAARRSALEQLLAPERGLADAYARIAGWAQPARVALAYPGLWLRADVYATHGHYLDCHLTIPTLERLSVGAMSRLLRPPAGDVRERRRLRGGDRAGVRVARRRGAGRAHRRRAQRPRHGAGLARARGGAGGATAGSPADRPRASRAGVRELRRRALVLGFPLAVAALNRAGLGPLRADISAGELRRAGLRAMGEVPRASASATPTWSSATPTAPARCPATTAGVARAARAPRARERGLLDLRLDLPHGARREPLLAGRVRARRGRRAARAAAAAAATARTRSSRQLGR